MAIHTYAYNANRGPAMQSTSTSLPNLGSPAMDHRFPSALNVHKMARVCATHLYSLMKAAWSKSSFEARP